MAGPVELEHDEPLPAFVTSGDDPSVSRSVWNQQVGALQHRAQIRLRESTVFHPEQYVAAQLQLPIPPRRPADWHSAAPSSGYSGAVTRANRTLAYAPAS